MSSATFSLVSGVASATRPPESPVCGSPETVISFAAPLCCSGVGVSSWLFTNRVKTLNEDLTYKIRKDSRNRVRIGEAVVQQCDKMASNGIVHIIDQVSATHVNQEGENQNENRHL